MAIKNNDGENEKYIFIMFNILFTHRLFTSEMLPCFCAKYRKISTKVIQPGTLAKFKLY